MRYYKTFIKQLRNTGWILTDEGHGGDIYPHYFRYDHPADDEGRTIEFVCDSCKDGSPGRILRMWQGGKEVVVQDYDYVHSSPGKL